MTTLYLIRHGETDWNAEGRLQGQADPPLNVNGVVQARRGAQKLRGSRIRRLYASSLQRAAMTAQIISAALGIPYATDPRFMEIDQGDWEGRLRAEIEVQDPERHRLWHSRPWKTSPPNGERLEQVRDRVYAGIDELIARHPDETFGLVTHRTPIAMLKMRWQGLARNEVRSLDLPNTYIEAVQVPRSTD